MEKPKFTQRLPGIIASGLTILVTTFWTYWGIAEMYHEGWWGTWLNRLPYLSFGTVCLIMTLIALKWPRIGGWILIVIGAGFTAWWWGPALLRGQLTMQRVLGQFPLSGALVLIGVLFLLEGRYRRHRAAWMRSEGIAPSDQKTPRAWLRRNWRYVLAIGAPLVVIIGVSIYYLPIVLTRRDDGNRGARTIQGNGITLIWAPEGPGWNWRQPWGGYPSWNSIALYGVPPIGFDQKPGYDWREGEFATQEDMVATNLCRYLSEDGLTLMASPQDIWRMPTVDDYVRSLVHDGQNAGCVWDAEFRQQVQCTMLPDKETPLWAPDQAPIYYWAADEYSNDRGYFVSYNGFVNATRKTGGNPRHSYRCVKEP